MNSIIFTKSELKDINSIMSIIEDAKIFQRTQDNYQWDDKYPLHEHIIDDINNGFSYVLKDINGEIIATVALPTGQDDFYSQLKKEPIKYMSISRLAINNKYLNKGYGKRIMREIEEKAFELNVSFIIGSTNIKNIGMNILFQKMGFLKTHFWESENTKNSYFYNYTKYLSLYK